MLAHPGPRPNPASQKKADNATMAASGMPKLCTRRPKKSMLRFPNPGPGLPPLVWR